MFTDADGTKRGTPGNGHERDRQVHRDLEQFKLPLEIAVKQSKDTVLGRADVAKEEVRSTVFDRSETRSYAMMLTKRAFVVLDAAGIELPNWIGQRIRGSKRTFANQKVMQNEYGPTTDNRTVARQTLTAWLLHHLQDR